MPRRPTNPRTAGPLAAANHATGHSPGKRVCSAAVAGQAPGWPRTSRVGPVTGVPAARRPLHLTVGELVLIVAAMLAGVVSVLDPLGTVLAVTILVLLFVRARPRLRALGLLLAGTGAGATIVLAVLDPGGSLGVGVSGRGACGSGHGCVVRQHAALSIPALALSLALLAVGAALVWRSRQPLRGA